MYYECNHHLSQWRSQARRIYGRIVNTVTNNDGFKEEGIIYVDCIVERLKDTGYEI